MSDLLTRRARLMGPNVPTFYEKPVHLVRGTGCEVWDADGKRYLDCYNNVPHVGHCHPKVVEAITKQASTLNTHTRYLHDTVLDYIERLTGKFNHDLSQAIMVCTGSEANDIALRMAQAVTGKTGIIATDATYHGNTALVSQLSTRKPPIGGYGKHVRHVPAPDMLQTPDDGTLFAAHVASAIADLQQTEHGFSGLILCPIFANEGFPSVQPGFLDKTMAAVRAAGGILIADEVQPGFGRKGTHWWGHDWIGTAPDVVTIGKPMANGHPVAATIARPDVMSAFREAFGYFNTFGGNPVSAAAALATFEVIEDEGLVENAAAMAQHALQRLQQLDHPLIADAREAGLFFGIELMRDGISATTETAQLVEKMRERGVLLNTIGRGRHILKMRPPLPITANQLDFAIDQLSQALTEIPA